MPSTIQSLKQAVLFKSDYAEDHSVSTREMKATIYKMTWELTLKKSNSDEYKIKQEEYRESFEALSELDEDIMENTSVKKSLLRKLKRQSVKVH